MTLARPSSSDRRPGRHRFDDRVVVGLLLLAGLLPRLVHLSTVRSSQFFAELLLDSRMYAEWARAIAAGRLLGDAPFFQDPLYAYFLGAVYAILGDGQGVGQAVQLLLGATVGPLLFLATRPWLGRPAAIGAGAIAALYMPSVYYEGMLLKTGLAVWLVTLALIALSVALRRSRSVTWLLTGSLLGLATLTRGNLLLCAVSLVAWLLLEPRPGTDGAAWPRQRRLRAGAALAVGCLAPLLLSLAHNRWTGGEWILTTSNAGQNFFIGNNPANRSGEYASLPFVDANPIREQADFRQEAERRLNRGLTAREASRYWFGQGLEFVSGRPGAWLNLTARKAHNYWDAYEIPDNFDFYLVREHAPVLRWPLVGFGIVGPLSLLGIWCAWPRGGWPRALVVFVVVYAASVVAFFVFSRFRMAAMPGLFVLAAYGGVELWRRWREARGDREARRPLLVAAFVLLVALAWVHLPVRAVVGSARARVAAILHLPARPETTATAHFNRGVALAARAREVAEPESLLAQAEQELRTALEQEDRYAPLHVELGKVLARQQRNREAIEVYLGAAEREPKNYVIQHSLAILYGREGEWGEAEGALRRALEIEPRHTASAVRLGRVLLEQQRFAEAARWFGHALKLSPSNREAAEGLAEARRRRESNRSDPTAP